MVILILMRVSLSEIDALGSVNISDGAALGVRSVVTKDIASNAIIAGISAKQIKLRG